LLAHIRREREKADKEFEDEKKREKELKKAAEEQRKAWEKFQREEEKRKKLEDNAKKNAGNKLWNTIRSLLSPKKSNEEGHSDVEMSWDDSTFDREDRRLDDPPEHPYYK